MRPTLLPDPPPRWGLALTWLLGLTALLGTVRAVVHRHILDRTSPGAPSVRVLEDPVDTVLLGWSRASRIDTFPEVLSVGDAVEADAGWLLLDHRARRVHLVGDEPGPGIRTFGRGGAGPGELELPHRIAVDGDRIGVLEARGDRLVQFRSDGTVLAVADLGLGRCGFGPGRDLFPFPGGGFVVLRACTTFQGESRGLLLHVGRDQEVTVLADHHLQSLRQPGADPFASPVAGALGEAVYTGTLSGGCLTPLVPAPDTRPTLCPARTPPVTLPDSARADLEALAERVARIGGALTIPELWPPFTAVRSIRDGLVLSIPTSGDRSIVDLVGPGARRIRFELEGDRPPFIGRRTILLVRDLVEGTELGWVRRDG